MSKESCHCKGHDDLLRLLHFVRDDFLRILHFIFAFTLNALFRGFGYWELERIWCLVLGIWIFIISLQRQEGRY